MTDTRQRILDTARMLFNERGVHRVGVRDIARAAQMSPGNLSYHFATKDDLVSALMLELHDRNARQVFRFTPEEFSFVTLYHTALGAMRNMLPYRFVLLSYVDAVLVSPELQALEARLRPLRRQRSEAMVQLLIRNGFVDGPAVERAVYLHEIAQMISSGWLRAAALDPVQRDEDATVRHYAGMGCALLLPYATPAGQEQVRQILAGLHDQTDNPQV